MSYRYLAILLGSTLLSSGCIFGGAEPDKYEPNDTQVEAKVMGSLIKLGSLHYADLNVENGNPDWFKVASLPPMRKCSATLTNLDGKPPVFLQIFSGPRKLGQGTEVEWDQEDPNGFFIMIDLHEEHDGPVTYDLVVKDLGPMGDDAFDTQGTPNNSRMEAKKWTGTKKPLWGFDEDWYKVRIPGLFGIILRIEPIGGAPSATYVLETAEEGEELASGTLQVPAEIKKTAAELASSRGSLVWGINPNDNPPFSYKMSLELLPPQLSQLDAALSALTTTKPKQLAALASDVLAAINSPKVEGTPDERGRVLEKAGRRLMQGGEKYWKRGLVAYGMAAKLDNPDARDRLNIMSKAVRHKRALRAYLRAEAAYDRGSKAEDKDMLSTALDDCQSAKTEAQDAEAQPVVDLCDELEGEIKVVLGGLEGN